MWSLPTKDGNAALRHVNNFDEPKRVSRAAVVGAWLDAAALAVTYGGRFHARAKRFPNPRVSQEFIPPDPDPKIRALVNMKKPPRTLIRGGFLDWATRF